MNDPIAASLRERHDLAQEGVSGITQTMSLLGTALESGEVSEEEYDNMMSTLQDKKFAIFAKYPEVDPDSDTYVNPEAEGRADRPLIDPLDLVMATSGAKLGEKFVGMAGKQIAKKAPGLVARAPESVGKIGKFMGQSVGSTLGMGDTSKEGIAGGLAIDAALPPAMRVLRAAGRGGKNVAKRAMRFADDKALAQVEDLFGMGQGSYLKADTLRGKPGLMRRSLDNLLKMEIISDTAKNTLKNIRGTAKEIGKDLNTSTGSISRTLTRQGEGIVPGYWAAWKPKVALDQLDGYVKSVKESADIQDVYQEIMGKLKTAKTFDDVLNAKRFMYKHMSFSPTSPATKEAGAKDFFQHVSADLNRGIDDFLEEQVHIGRIPKEWKARFEDLNETYSTLKMLEPEAARGTTLESTSEQMRAATDEVPFMSKASLLTRAARGTERPMLESAGKKLNKVKSALEVFDAPMSGEKSLTSMMPAGTTRGVFNAMEQDAQALPLSSEEAFSMPPHSLPPEIKNDPEILQGFDEVKNSSPQIKRQFLGTVYEKYPNAFKQSDNPNLKGIGIIDGKAANEMQGQKYLGTLKERYKSGDMTLEEYAPLYDKFNKDGTILEAKMADESAFQDAFDSVLGREGGYQYTNIEGDKPTKAGITQDTYDNYRMINNMPEGDVKDISAKEVRDIYKEQYWDKMQANDLPGGVREMAFDASVNMGVSRATKMLQKTLNNQLRNPLEEDGLLGYKTLMATRGAEVTQIVRDFAGLRREFYTKLGQRPEKAKFKDGWLNRVDDIEAQSLQLLAQNGVTVAVPSEPVSKDMVKTKYTY